MKETPGKKGRNKQLDKGAANCRTGAQQNSWTRTQQRGVINKGKKGAGSYWKGRSKSRTKQRIVGQGRSKLLDTGQGRKEK